MQENDTFSLLLSAQRDLLEAYRQRQDRMDGRIERLEEDLRRIQKQHAEGNVKLGLIWSGIALVAGYLATQVIDYLKGR